MPITDIDIKDAPPKDKPYKIYDDKGLYVIITRAGKYLRYDYRFAGKRKTLALGVYPITSLADARAMRDSAKKLLLKWVDPLEQKKKDKIEAINAYLSRAKGDNDKNF